MVEWEASWEVRKLGAGLSSSTDVRERERDLQGGRGVDELPETKELDGESGTRGLAT